MPNDIIVEEVEKDASITEIPIEPNNQVTTNLQPIVNQNATNHLQAPLVNPNMASGQPNPSIHMMNQANNQVNSLMTKPPANSYMNLVNNNPSINNNTNPIQLQTNIKGTRMSTPEKQRGANRKKAQGRGTTARNSRMPIAQQQQQQQAPQAQIGLASQANWQTGTMTNSLQQNQPGNMYQQHPSQRKAILFAYSGFSIYLRNFSFLSGTTTTTHEHAERDKYINARSGRQPANAKQCVDTSTTTTTTTIIVTLH